MVLKKVFIAIVYSTLLVWSDLSLADEHRSDRFLRLDLSKAALSPKPLGPPAVFVPVAGEARADRGNARTAAVTHRKIHVAHVRGEKRHAAAHPRLARHHGIPLDAQAFDTRVQAWPCKSGGICNWK
jgi:hypothetical protein